MLMVPSTLCVLTGILSSLAAANGAFVQRDGSFYIRQATTSSLSSSSTSATQTTTSSTTSTSALTTSTLTLVSTSTTNATSVTSTSTSNATTAPSTSPTMTSATTATSLTTSRTATAPGTATTPGTASATATSTPAPGTVDCTSAQNWQAAFAYVAGNEVIFNGQLYKAKQWTYNNAPPTHPDQWSAVGPCSQPINNLANCNGIATWSSTVAYTTGQQVTYQGHLWSAVQWVQSSAPGDLSGSWKDLGACGSTSATTTSTIPVTLTSSTALPSTTSGTATATSTPAPGTVDCTGVQNWQAAFAYVTGNEAIFNGQLYKAKQWTYNNAPPTHPDQWAAVGACSQPVKNLANCSGAAAWSSAIAYTTGGQVTYQGHLWSAVQWVQSNAPGDSSGSWKDLGACA